MKQTVKSFVNQRRVLPANFSKFESLQ